MPAERRTSLVFRLTASLIGFQLVLFVLILTAFAWLISHQSGRTIDEHVVSTVAESIRFDPQGRLSLDDTPAMRSLEHLGALWFVARDDAGHELRRGAVPSHYEGLAALLPSLGDSAIWARQNPTMLAARIVVHDTPSGPVHLLVGGAPSQGTWSVLKMLVDAFGLRLMLPLALVTLCVIPWLTRRALKGVSRAAREAGAINIRKRDARLSEAGLPSEVQPLVRAVNDALARLSEGYDANDRFLAGAAHELRAPIAILEARVGMLAPGATRTRLLADVARLSNLAETLLDLQRLGRRLSELKPVDLRAVAHQVASDMAPLVLDAGYDIEVNSGGTPVRVAGDGLALGRALINLVQNAIAHGGGRGLISLDVETDGALRVRDQGPGVAPDQRERIFEPFYRLQPSDRGTGLGLHLVREIVDLHQGSVEVAEVPGGGACFEIRLPRLAPAVDTDR